MNKILYLNLTKYIKLVVLLILFVSCQDQNYIVSQDKFNNLKIEGKTHKDSLETTHYTVHDANNKLVRTYTTIKRLKEGKDVGYYKNGNREYEVHFKNDSLNGEAKFYYDNTGNSIESVHNYERGTIVGVQKKYYPSGRLQYYIGQLYNGDIAYKLEYSEDGNILKEEGRYKILGTFERTDFSSNKRIQYTAHIATPAHLHIKYEYSINSPDAPKEWRTLPINNSQVFIDTLINVKGRYSISERLTISANDKNHVEMDEFKFYID